MNPEPEFNAQRVAKTLLREGRSGALATLMPETGDPYCSLVGVATEMTGAPLLLISKLAVHTKNILQDPRISLMIDERKDGDPLQGARVMLMGKAIATSARRPREAYLQRQTKAEQYALFSDFAVYSVLVERALLVGGFGRIANLTAAEILTDTADAAALIEAQDEAIAHMNTDHADTLRLYATKLLGAADGDWRCVGVDPEGLELQNGRAALRLFFPQRVTGPGPLRAVLKQLADAARAN